jgi:broad specificity phosphatase PhoE
VLRSRIHLCRHGEVDKAWRSRIYGASDVALADAGKARFDAIADDLARIEFAAIYASDLERAKDGAGRIAAACRLEVVIDPRLREIDRGEWVGLTLDEIEERWPGGVDAYLADPNGYAGHGGETHRDLADRVWPVLEELADRHVGEQVLVVCHGQLMRAVVARALGISGARSLNLMTGNGGLTTVDRFDDGVWVVQAVNAPTLRGGEWGGREFKP